MNSGHEFPRYQIKVDGLAFSYCGGESMCAIVRRRVRALTYSKKVKKVLDWHPSVALMRCIHTHGTLSWTSKHI
jgi:hypothetical protein